MLYKGSCHCGAVRYKVEMEIESVLSCNCSICIRKGALLAFTPAANFTLEQGDASLTNYQFGSKTIHHLFCTVCGIASFAKGKLPDGTEMRAINVRCLEDVDLDAIPVQKYDGKHI